MNDEEQVKPSVYGVSPREVTSRPSSPSTATTNGSTARVGVTGCPSHVVAGVAWYPDTDFLALGPDRTGSPDPTSPEALLIGGPTRDRREDAAFASPVTHVHAGAAPILLVHGLEDGLLPPEQSALMHEALQTVGATSELEWIEGADHMFFGVDPDPIADRSADFLVRHLARRARLCQGASSSARRRS